MIILEGTILREVKAFYPRKQITRIFLNFSDFFLPIPAPGKMSSHFDFSKYMKFSTSRTHTHQSEEGYTGRDARNRLKNEGKVNTSARGRGKTPTNMWEIFHTVWAFFKITSLYQMDTCMFSVVTTVNQLTWVSFKAKIIYQVSIHPSFQDSWRGSASAWRHLRKLYLSSQNYANASRTL